MKLNATLTTILLVFCLARSMEAAPGVFGNFLKNIKKTINEVVGDKAERTDGKPWFCHDLDCPEFKTVRKIVDEDDDELVIEERCYPQTNWVQTGLDGDRDNMEYSPMFKKLFGYIQKGENKKKEKIAMTAPVLVSVTEKNEETSHANMGFFIPAAEASSAPAPTKDDVSIVKMAPMCVYVMSYGGWQMSLDEKFRGKVDTLKNTLKKAGIKDLDESAGPMFAGYDSPWRLLNRHNEVMLLKKSPQVQEN